MSLGNPLNLAAPEFAKPSEPPVHCGLIYKRKRHAVSGPPEAAKTLLVLIIALEAERAGTRVAFIDFESGPAETRRLLEDLGATLEEIAAIDYYEAEGSPEDDDLQRLFIDTGVELVIIDAAAGAYNASGLDEEKRKDIEAWANAWVRPLWRAGIATILVDHVVKNRNNRGAFAIGGERKLGGVDVHLGLAAVSQMSRGKSGLIKITTHKDRPAWLPRPRTGDLELHSDPTTHAITWRIKPASDDTADPIGWRPTVLMERVSRYLERQTDEVPVTAIYKNVKGKKEYVAEATLFLIGDSFATERPGNRGSRLIRSIKPYREPVPTLSQPVPTASDPPCPAVPSPLGEEQDSHLWEDKEPVDHDELEQVLPTSNGHVPLDEVERLAAIAREYEA